MVQGISIDNERFSIRHLLMETMKILLPVDLSNILQTSSQTVTMIFVGHHLGEIGISQYSAGVLIFNVGAMSIVSGLGSAIDTICSQANGQNSRSRVIGETLQRALLIDFLLGILMSIVFLTCKPLLILIFGEAVGDGAAKFLSYCPLYLVFQIINGTTSKIFYAQRLPGLVACANAAAAITSPIANYFLTPRGVHGAAFSLTCNAGFCAIACVLFCILHPKVAVREARWPSPALLDREGWMSFLRVGVPSLIAVCSEWWAFEVQSLFAIWISPTALAVHGVIMNVVNFMFSVAIGVSVSASVMIGNALGARKHKLASQYAYFIILCDVIIGVFTATLMGVFGGHIARIYTNVPEVANAVESAMPLVILCHVGDSLQFCLQGVFRGAGRPKQAANGVLLTMWLIGLPASALYVFVFHWGVKGIIGGLTTGIAFEVPLLLYMMSRWDWAKLEQEAHMVVTTQEFAVLSEEATVAAGGIAGGCASFSSMSEMEYTVPVEAVEVVEVHPYKPTTKHYALLLETKRQDAV